MLKQILLYSFLAVLTAGVLVNPASVQSADQYSCTSCPQCSGLPGTSRHQAPLGGGGFAGNGGHECWDVACGHPSCGGQASLDSQHMSEEIDNLLDRAFDGDAGAVLALVNVYPEQAEVNHERMALQVSAPCETGGITAHIPLTGEMVAAIELRERQVRPRLT